MSHSRQNRLVISACAFPVFGGPALRGAEVEDKDGGHRELNGRISQGPHQKWAQPCAWPLSQLLFLTSACSVSGACRQEDGMLRGVFACLLVCFPVPTVHS